MTDVTKILVQIDVGDPSAAEKLLPLVYEELRKLAALRLDHERAGQTLQPTALVHEAYMRLVDVEKAQSWDSKGHFFAAAAEAMRRILVDAARYKHSVKQGGGYVRRDLDEGNVVAPKAEDDILALNDALERLASADEQAAELVKLRYFGGLTSKQAAQVLAVSARTADRIWVYARSFLLREMDQT